MRTGKVLLGATLACISALGIHAPGLAQQQDEKVEAAKARDEATNKALLAALLQRRAEIAQSPVEPSQAEGRRYALDFLDQQIAKVRKTLGD